MIKIGEIYPSNNYGDMEVIEYVNCNRVLIRFIATGYERYAASGDIRKGRVKDPYSPSVAGIGYLGLGDYVTKINREHTKEYQVWRDMLRRCYETKSLEKRPTYKGCTVVPEWHNFQVFSAWFIENYILGYHLDKDIKITGNRIYGPDTCMFVTPAENTEAAWAVTAIFKSPESDRVEVYNIAKFARENGLDGRHLTNVKNGKLKQHKGWTKWPD